MSFAVLALTVLLPLLGSSGLPAEDGGMVALEVRGERLTLQAENVPLAVILKRLVEAVGIAIYLEEPTKERVSVALTNVGVEEGMRRLLKHRNTLFLYNKSQGVPSAIYVLGPRGGTTAFSISQPSEALEAAAEPTEDGEVDVEVARLEANQKIGELEETLRAAGIDKPAEESPLLQELMSDADHAVRITALQWSSGHGEAGIDALVTALTQTDDLVRRVAMQIILDRGASEEAIQEVMAAAEEDNEKAVRQMLRAILTER